MALSNFGLRSSLLAMTILGAACTTSSAPSTQDPGTPAAPECRGNLPASLSVSEGGLLRLPATADATYEGLGGAVATVEEGSLLVRAPYLAAAEAEVGIRLACGQTIPLELRPLAWNKLATWDASSGAPAREYGAWWLDPEGALVVFGGFHYVPKQFTPANDAWRFDFGTNAWSPLAGDALPTLPGGRAAPIPGERAVYLFGGIVAQADGGGETPASMYRLDFDAARLTATKVEPLGAAPGSYTGSLMYDGKRRRWLSVCGVDSATGANCNVDAFTPERGFERVTTAGKAPKGRWGFHYAYDEASDRVIVFGGQVGAGDDAIDGETWALDLAVDPPAWSRLFANGKGPTKRRNGAFALDPVGHRLFLWGGTPDGADSVKNLQALTLDRGAEAWNDIPMPKEVPSRTSAIGIHDAPRDRLLFGFGNDDDLYYDLWALDVGNGQSTSTTPTSRQSR